MYVCVCVSVCVSVCVCVGAFGLYAYLVCVSSAVARVVTAPHICCTQIIFTTVEVYEETAWWAETPFKGFEFSAVTRV
jgi:hypothetical protein